MAGNQNTPSVIARLMGIDELQPQKPSHRQLKVLSEDYLRKSDSIGMLRESSLLFSRLSRKTTEKQHAVKQVSGSVIPKNEKQSLESISGLKSNQGTTKAQLSFGRQRSAFAKELALIDKKLCQAKELNDALEDQHMTRDNSLRYFAQSNLSTNQLRDAENFEIHPCHGHLTTPIFTSSPTHTESKQSNQLDEMARQMKFVRSQNLDTRCGEFETEHMNEFSEKCSELKDNAGNFSTRIIVLKPNLRKTQESVLDLHLQRSDILHQKGDMGYREYGELSQYKSRALDEKVMETEKMTAKPPTYSFKDPWQVENRSAKEQCKRMSSTLRYASRSRITTEDSSVHAPKALMTSSQGSFGWKYRQRVSSPFPSWSFFACEAKKQIFERWKTTRNFEEVEVAGQRCSLGQMFAMQDKESMPTSLYSKLEKESSEIGSSKVVLTNENIGNQQRPKLLKNSFCGSETSGFKTRVEASTNGCSSGQKEALIDKHQKLKSEKFHGRNSSHSTDSTVICKEHHQYISADLEGSHNPDYELSSSKILSSVSDDNILLEVSQGVQDDLKEDMHKEAGGYSSSDVSDNLALQKSSCDSTGEELVLTCTAEDSELAINLREINQPSPNSVLEPFFKEEKSGSAVFESPVSDLSGLALKLHLLSPESEETKSEGSGMAVSSDEDIEKGSVDLSQDNEKPWGMSTLEESRDFSYLVDVLDEANWCSKDLAMWHGTDSPLCPSVFEALEKKYGKQISWAKSERRLLFDLINFRLGDFLGSCMEFCTSTKPLRRRLTTTLRRDDVEEELWMLLSQDKGVSKDLAEKVLGEEMNWMELKGDITIICTEIVDYIFDELAAEFCSSESA